jgi:hypothetical protein
LSTKTKEFGRRNNAQQIKNETGGENSTKWRRHKCVQHSGLRTCVKRDSLGDADVHGEDNIKTDLQETRCRGVDWVNLIQNREQWQLFVNTAMKICVPQKTGNLMIS